eukprot:1003355-Amorphochlora_amoeboformis.AAC.1
MTRSYCIARKSDRVEQIRTQAFSPNSRNSFESFRIRTYQRCYHGYIPLGKGEKRYPPLGALWERKNMGYHHDQGEHGTPPAEKCSVTQPNNSSQPQLKISHPDGVDIDTRRTDRMLVRSICIPGIL